MHFGRYEISCTLLDDAQLPPYKGSTFRGAFGGALKRVVCAVRHKDCPSCLLSKRCVYAATFEAEARSVDPRGLLAARPHPYVIEPPTSRKTHFFKGESFDFSLILFGDANQNLPYYIYAFEQMGEGGVGKKIGDTRARLCVTGVRMGSAEIFDAGCRSLEPVAVPVLALPEVLDGKEETVVTVNLETPLRLKQENRLQASLPFHILVRAMLRRISSLYAAYGNGEPSLDYRGLVARAAEVETISSRLRWHDWERYSHRQDKTMLMGGMLGSVTYRGKLTEYLPLLELCREFHVGKQTSFGLGKITFKADLA